MPVLFNTIVTGVSGVQLIVMSVEFGKTYIQLFGLDNLCQISYVVCIILTSQSKGK